MWNTILLSNIISKIQLCLVECQDTIISCISLYKHSEGITEDVYTNLFAASAEADFVWLATGETTGTYNNWASGQPDRSGDPAYSVRLSYGDSWKWAVHELPTSSLHKYLCMKECKYSNH